MINIIQTFDKVTKVASSQTGSSQPGGRKLKTPAQNTGWIQAMQEAITLTYKVENKGTKLGHPGNKIPTNLITAQSVLSSLKLWST